MANSDFSELQPSQRRFAKKFQLWGALFREDSSSKKDFSGYLNIPISEIEGFARAIGEAPRVAYGDGGQQVRFKIAGWTAEAKGNTYIRLAIDDR